MQHSVRGTKGSGQLGAGGWGWGRSWANIQVKKKALRGIRGPSGGLAVVMVGFSLLPFELPEPPFPEEVEEDEVVVAWGEREKMGEGDYAGTIQTGVGTVYLVMARDQITRTRARQRQADQLASLKAVLTIKKKIKRKNE